MLKLAVGAGALGAGLWAGMAFPLLGLLAIPLVAVFIISALLRHWFITLLVCAFLYANWRHNHAGPAYAPPGTSTSVGRPNALLPEDRPRIGRMHVAGDAVKADARRTLTSEVVLTEGGRVEGSVSLRNPSAFASVEVTRVSCTAKTAPGARGGNSTYRQAAVNETVPPGGSFQYGGLVFGAPDKARQVGVEGWCEVGLRAILP